MWKASKDLAEHAHVSFPWPDVPPWLRYPLYQKRYPHDLDAAEVMQWVETRKSQTAVGYAIAAQMRAAAEDSAPSCVMRACGV